MLKELRIESVTRTEGDSGSGIKSSDCVTAETSPSTSQSVVKRSTTLIKSATVPSPIRSSQPLEPTQGQDIALVATPISSSDSTSTYDKKDCRSVPEIKVVYLLLFSIMWQTPAASPAISSEITFFYLFFFFSFYLFSFFPFFVFLSFPFFLFPFFPFFLFSSFPFTLFSFFSFLNKNLNSTLFLSVLHFWMGRQLDFFHPLFTNPECDQNDPSNFLGRSPYPTILIQRRADSKHNCDNVS